jgi:hypothetical protein
LIRQKLTSESSSLLQKKKKYWNGRDDRKVPNKEKSIRDDFEKNGKRNPLGTVVSRRLWNLLLSLLFGDLHIFNVIGSLFCRCI